VAGRPNNQAAIANHIQGMRELKAKFQALPEETREAFNKATWTTMSEIRRLARQHLMSSPAIRTRALHDHVDFKLNEKNGIGVVGISTARTTISVNSGKSFRVKGIVIAGRGGSASTSQGAKFIRPTRYAHLIEFGRARAKAEPFMRPAVQAQKGQYESRMRDAARGVERKLSTTSGML
jgi:HK97 gp10 family phage protein